MSGDPGRLKATDVGDPFAISSLVPRTKECAWL